MGMVGKKVTVGKSVSDGSFSDDPTDSEIIRQLDGAEDLVALPSDGWEVVLGTREGRVVKEAGVIVMGALLVMGDPPTVRRSAEHLTDKEVWKLIRGAFPFSVSFCLTQV